MEDKEYNRFQASHKQKNILIIVLAALVLTCFFIVAKVKNVPREQSVNKQAQEITIPSPSPSPTPIIYDLPSPTIPQYQTKKVTMMVNNGTISELVLDIPLSWSQNDNKTTIESQDLYIDTSEYPLHESGSFIVVYPFNIESNTRIEDVFRSPYGPILGRVYRVDVNKTPVIFFSYDEEGSAESYSFQLVHEKLQYNIKLYTPADPSFQYISRDIQVVWHIIDQLTK